MHTLLICMSVFVESTYDLYGLWRYTALLVICEKTERFINKTHLCGHVKFIFDSQSKFAE